MFKTRSPLLMVIVLSALFGCPQLDCRSPERNTEDQICKLSFDPESSETIVVSTIDSADVSIDIALYGFENEAVTEALLAAATRGVVIRGCTDYDSESESGWQALIEAQRDLGELDITVRLGNESGIMHNKYLVIDQTYVITGSTNLTEGMWGHFNNLILIRSPLLAEDFMRDFEVLFAGYNASEKGNSSNMNTLVDSDGSIVDENGFNTLFGEGEMWPERVYRIGEYSVQAFFTPYKALFPSYRKEGPVSYSYYNYESGSYETESYDNAMNIIFSLVDEAERSIDIYSFAFTDKVLMDRLALAEQRGVLVRVWMDYTMFRSGFSYSGKSIIALSQKISSFKLCRKPDGGLLHHKVLLIDGETVVLGSLNFSSNAVSNNDENFLVIRNAGPMCDAFMNEAEKIDRVSHEIRIDEDDIAAEVEQYEEGE